MLSDSPQRWPIAGIGVTPTTQCTLRACRRRENSSVPVSERRPVAGCSTNNCPDNRLRTAGPYLFGVTPVALIFPAIGQSLMAADQRCRPPCSVSVHAHSPRATRMLCSTLHLLMAWRGGTAGLPGRPAPQWYEQAGSDWRLAKHIDRAALRSADGISWCRATNWLTGRTAQCPAILGRCAPCPAAGPDTAVCLCWNLANAM